MAKSPPKPDPLIGTTLGRYTIESRLGAGGMGAVYRAKEAGMLGRTVALKVLPARLAGEGEFVARFAREAQRAAGLKHGNVVQIYDADQADGNYFIAMQLMEGGSLADLISRHGALDPMVAARVVRDSARGLACAHAAGIVHRDVKPANIFLDDHGARLGDFGLVKALDGDDQPLTQTGMILGTPHYMAPEQCEGATDVDHRADLYALGLVLYHALSGKIPAKGSTPLQIIRYRCMEDPEPLRQVRPAVPATLATLVDELLVRERDERLGDAAELARRLDHFLGDASGDAATLVSTDSALVQSGPISQAVTGSHAGQPKSDPSSVDTVDLSPGGGSDSGVAPSTGLNSSPPAPPPPPPPPSHPAAHSAPTPPQPPSRSATGAAAQPPRPPSTHTRKPKTKSRFVLYTCVALFVGLIVLPAGCITLVLIYSDDAFDFPVPGEESRRPEDLEAFLFGLQALGGRPHVQLQVAEFQLNEHVDMGISGTVLGSGLTLELGPFEDSEFGDDWRIKVVLDAPHELIRPARGFVANADRGDVPDMTLVGAKLSEGALVISGHWNIDRRKQLPITIRVSSEAPPSDWGSEDSGRLPDLPSAGPANPEEVFERFDRDRMQDPEGAGAFFMQALEGAMVGVEVQGVRHDYLYCTVEVVGENRVAVHVSGLAPEGPLNCEAFSVVFDLDLYQKGLAFQARRFVGLRDGREITVELYSVEPMVAYQVNGEPGLLVSIEPDNGLIAPDQLLIYLGSGNGNGKGKGKGKGGK